MGRRSIPRLRPGEDLVARTSRCCVHTSAARGCISTVSVTSPRSYMCVCHSWQSLPKLRYEWFSYIYGCRLKVMQHV